MSERPSPAELVQRLLDGATPKELNLSNEEVAALAREAASSLREVDGPWFPVDKPGALNYTAIAFAHLVLTGVVKVEDLPLEMLKDITQHAVNALRIVLQLHGAGEDIEALAVAATKSYKAAMVKMDEVLDNARRIREAGREPPFTDSISAVARLVARDFDLESEDLRIRYQRRKSKTQ